MTNWEVCTRDEYRAALVAAGTGAVRSAASYTVDEPRHESMTEWVTSDGAPIVRIDVQEVDTGECDRVYWIARRRPAKPAPVRSTAAYFRAMAKACSMRARAELAEARAITVRPDMFLIESIPSHASHEASLFSHVLSACSYRESAANYRRFAAEEDARDLADAERRARWAAEDAARVSA